MTYLESAVRHSTKRVDPSHGLYLLLHSLSCVWLSAGICDRSGPTALEDPTRRCASQGQVPQSAADVVDPPTTSEATVIDPGPSGALRADRGERGETPAVVKQEPCSSGVAAERRAGTVIAFIDLTEDVEDDSNRRRSPPEVVGEKRPRVGPGPSDNPGGTSTSPTCVEEAGPSREPVAPVRQCVGSVSNNVVPQGRPAAADPGPQPSVPGTSREQQPAPPPEKPDKSFQRYFRKSHIGSNGLLYERSNYSKGRAIVSEEAANARRAVARRNSELSQRRGGEAPASQGGPSPTAADRVIQRPREGSAGVIRFPGGVEISPMQDGQENRVRVKLQKQYLGKLTKSAQSNKEGRGIFVSEWTATFPTPLDARLGLLYRLSFLQELEIKLGLHHHTGTDMVKCYRDANVRSILPDFLDRYESIRENMREEINAIFSMYDCDASLASILYSNNSSAQKPQNNVNMVRAHWMLVCIESIDENLTEVCRCRCSECWNDTASISTTCQTEPKGPYLSLQGTFETATVLEISWEHVKRGREGDVSAIGRGDLP